MAEINSYLQHSSEILCEKRESRIKNSIKIDIFFIYRAKYKYRYNF